MNAKISVFVICAKAIIYLLLFNLYGCTFYASSTAFTRRFNYFMICSENQWTGFYMTGTSVMKELNRLLRSLP